MAVQLRHRYVVLLTGWQVNALFARPIAELILKTCTARLITFVAPFSCAPNFTCRARAHLEPRMTALASVEVESVRAR